MATPTRYTALLRGINVGGNHRVPMAELRELIGELGYSDVATLLQSGNAVFTSTDSAATVSSRLETALGDHFGFTPRVIVRTLAQIRKVIAADPFEGIADDPSRYLVLFAAAKLDPAAFAHLDPQEFAPEQWAIHGAELYCWMPNSVSKSKLMPKLPGPRKGVDLTGRNWNTVLKLLALLEDA